MFADKNYLISSGLEGGKLGQGAIHVPSSKSCPAFVCENIPMTGWFSPFLVR